MKNMFCHRAVLLLSGVSIVTAVKQYYEKGVPYVTPNMSLVPPEELYHDPDRFMEPLPKNFTLEGKNFTFVERHSHEFRRPVSNVFLPTSVKYDLLEENRPHRFSPPYRASEAYTPRYYDMFGGRSWLNVGCMCSTVIHRYTNLAGCAVITRQHVLTTASSTENAIKKLDLANSPSIDDIYNKGLGVWYDTDEDLQNTSYYSIPSRIHFHPDFNRGSHFNLTHPVHIYDIAVWTMVQELHDRAIVCMRGAPSFSYSTTPRPKEQVAIVGYQFIRAYNRNPLPTARYLVKSQDHVNPCPKLEWGWYHCLGGRWAPLGMDNGAGLYRVSNKYSNGMQGLIGLGAFSMKLRSEGITHYFTVLNTHYNLDFFYEAFMGRPEPILLCREFQNTQWGAPSLLDGQSLSAEIQSKLKEEPEQKDWNVGKEYF